MNAAEKATLQVIEESLRKSPAYRRVDDCLHVVKQGSAYVMINIVPWGENKAMARCVAQLVKGISMDGKLAQQLIELNAQLRFGAFAYDRVHKLILFIHSILGGPTLDPEELITTVSDVALISDEYDDKIVAKYGGQTMRDLLEEAAFERLIHSDPQAFPFPVE